MIKKLGILCNKKINIFLMDTSMILNEGQLWANFLSMSQSLEFLMSIRLVPLYFPDIVKGRTQI